MNRLLATFIATFWCAYFGVLALSAMAPVGRSPFVGVAAVPSSLTGVLAHADAPLLAAILAFAFALTAVLFAWMLVATVLDGSAEQTEADEVTRMAVSVAVGATMLAMLAGWIEGRGWPLETVSLQMVALAATYLAVAAERRRAPQTQARQVSRELASEAAYSSMLERLSARSRRRPGGSL